MKAQLKIINPLIANLPEYKTPGSAAIDLMACIDHSIALHPNEVKMIPTGIAIYLEDPNVVGLILPRSGLGHKNGLVLGNLTGVIDSDYQGEMMISMWNRSTTTQIINPMDRVAQYMVVPVIKVQFDVVDKFVESERGSGGFGSTGVSS